MSCDKKDELPAELRERLERLQEEPAVKIIMETTGNLPVWGMMGAAIGYFVQDFAKRTGRISPKSPKLMSLGVTTAGLLCGFQAGIWHLYRTVSRVDPDGSKDGEAKALFAEVRKARLSQSCQPRQPTASLPEFRSESLSPTKPKTNQYGDVIEDDTFK